VQPLKEICSDSVITMGFPA